MGGGGGGGDSPGDFDDMRPGGINMLNLFIIFFQDLVPYKASCTDACAVKNHQ